MKVIVQKFGGSSIESLERIEKVAELIGQTTEQGTKVVVVVSAMFGETDRLIQMANHIDKAPNAREYAQLVTAGEQVSMALMTMALHKRGIKAMSLTGGQAGIHTDNLYERAQITHVDEGSINGFFEQGYQALVVAGFQGVGANGDITTLGRGGSDTTAVAIAAALKAQECQIYTDVDGIYTTDPHLVKEAKRLDQISIDEMLALASSGAKVLQEDAVSIAAAHKVPLRVLSSYQPGPGTLVTYDHVKEMDGQVTGIAHEAEQVQFNITNLSEGKSALSELISKIEQSALGVDFVQLHEQPDEQCRVTFVTSVSDSPKIQKLLVNHYEKNNKINIDSSNSLAKVSAVCSSKDHGPDKVLKALLAALQVKNIRPKAVHCNGIKVSILMDEKFLELGVRSLHQHFFGQNSNISNPAY